MLLFFRLTLLCLLSAGGTARAHHRVCTHHQYDGSEEEPLWAEWDPNPHCDMQYKLRVRDMMRTLPHGRR